MKKEKSKKIIHTFSVKIKKEVKETKVSNENGEEVRTTKTVLKEVPIKIRIVKPSSRMVKEMELERSRKTSELIKSGFLSESMMAKKYAENGGVMSQENAKLYFKLTKEISGNLYLIEQLQAKIDRTEKDEENLKELQKEMADLVFKLGEFQVMNVQAFEHCAESKALSHIIFWFMLYCTEKEEIEYDAEGNEKDSKWVPFFEGRDFEEKENSFFEMEEDEDQLLIAAITKLNWFCTYYVRGAASEPKQFENLEKNLDQGTVGLT